MQETDPTYEQSHRILTDHATRVRHFLMLSLAVLVVLLLVLLPPLINFSRYQRRIATSIGASLGRPVHLDKVTLNLLPLPSFTLQNLVVGEDPAFGDEPAIRANTVEATLRISSLWRKRVEFSTISFKEPSVNLVHNAAGQWNIESILLQASRIDAAPTGQRSAGSAPRFPYIEATGARLNLKLDQEKTPFSLTDAEFALWLPNPGQWRLRLQAHPARTDSSVSDTGTLKIEGSLGHAVSLGEVPVSLQGEWSNAPLGEATRLLFGHDAGLRGDMTLSANVQGTVASSAIQTRLRLADARRADFVPERPLAVDLECLATATAQFHAFDNLRCTWPPASTSAAPTLALSGSLGDLRRPKSLALDLAAPGIPAATLLDWFRVASARVPANLSVAGTFTGSLSYHPVAPHRVSSSRPARIPTGHIATDRPLSNETLPGQTLPGHPWTGQMLITGASLVNPRSGALSLVAGDIAVASQQQAAPAPRHGKRPSASPQPTGVFLLAPTSLDLGGNDPATLDGRFDAHGYTLHLTGMASIARLLALAAAIPQFGDSLARVLPTNRAAGPIRVDLTANRTWGGSQVWTDNTVRVAPPRRSTRR